MPTKDEIQEFSLKIEELSDINEVHCIESILQYCEESGIELDVAATLISAHLKNRIREEAQSINLIKKNSKLPI